MVGGDKVRRVDRDDLAFAGLSRHADLIAAGEVSSRELTELFLARIARLDPRLNAFRVVFSEQALIEADQADGRRRGGDLRPLLGVPIAIKDDIHVAGEITGYGCDWDPPVQPADSEVVRRLRAAGAVIIGKTHVPELMATGFTESPTYGVTRNPWDLDRTSGGSSGGSASAVAAGLVSAALGSDGAGSIRIPAACCHLFGFKPQRGRVSTAPDVDPDRGMAVFGALARSVEDSARIMDVLRDGGPAFAEAAAAEPGRLRIAVSVGLPPLGVKVDAEQRAGVTATAELLRSLGHEVVERELDWGLSLGNRVLTRFVRGLGDLAIEVGHRDRYSRRVKGIARIGTAIPSRLADSAGVAAAEDSVRLNKIFDESDVVLTPMFTRRPLRVREYDGMSGIRTLTGQARWAPYSAAFNHTGQPAASVPAGFTDDGFPLAVQLVGPFESEARLFSLSAQLERARAWPTARPAVAA
jgi:amidase